MLTMTNILNIFYIFNATVRVDCGFSILRLSYCNIVGNGTLACRAFQPFLPQDYTTIMREMNFG